MRNYIILNGQNSNSIQGLLIQSLAPISKPQMRTQIEEIDGRNGDIVEELGFAAYDKQITIGLYGEYNVDDVIAYFNSKGTVIFSNEPDKYYNYQITDQIDFERLIRYKTATVTMHCQPFKYSTTEGAESLTPSDNLLSIPDFTKTTNGLTVTAKDGLITLQGTGSAATEFYVPTGGLNLPAGSYTLTATASGRGATATSIRLIKSAPSDADTFGGKYVTLKNAPVTVSSTLSAATTYNYLWFYINANVEINFTLTVEVEDDASKVASGEDTALVLEGTGEAPFSKLEPKGNAEQTTYSGKNLFDISKVITAANEGVVNNGDGTLTVNGYGRSGASPNKLSDYCPTLKVGDTVILSMVVDANAMPMMRLNGSSYNWNRNTTRTITATDLSSQVVFYNTGGTVSGKISNIQIEIGSTASDFEQFVGGTASPNPDYPQAIEVVTGEQTVEVTGKNLFDKDNADTANGYLSGSNGAFVSGGGSYATKNATFLPAGDYVASQMLEKVCHYALDGSYIGLITRTGSNNEKFTMPSKGYVRLQFPSSFSADTFQLELGSRASEYQPYQGQSYEINLGKNLFDKDNAPTLNNLYIDSTGAVATGDGNRFTYLELSPNTTYTLTQGVKGGTNIRIALFSQTPASGSQGTLIGTTYTTAPITLTFTTTATNRYIGWAYANINNLGGHTIDEILGSIQVERGTQATSYASYFTPIELAKIGTYQDRIYKDDGKWYIEKQVGKEVFDSSTLFRWSVYGTGTANYMYLYQTISNSVAGAVLMSNYGQKGNVSPANTEEGILIVANGLVRIRIGAEISLDDWKAKLTATPMVLYYQLATPTTTEITNEALIEQLEALGEAHSYKNRTHIMAIATGNNAPHIIAAEVVKSSDGTVTNSGNIYSKPKLTIYGEGDIGIYLNGVQIFQIALGNEGYITIDTDAMEAYKDTTNNLKNRLVTGDYENFALQVGENQITFSGSVTKCIVENYSRWL